MIHFPIALLLVAPVFIVLAIVVPSRSHGFALSALVLLILGTVSAFVAVETGEAAAELVTRTEALGATLDRHAEAAETARNVFLLLTALYAGIMALPFVLKERWRAAYARVANTTFLVLLVGGCLLLANVAHQGGMLVHRFGVQSMVAP